MAYRIIAGIGNMRLAGNVTSGNPVNMMTLDNMLTFGSPLAVAGYVEGSTLATLSDGDMFPDMETVCLCAVESGGTLSAAFLHVNSDGTLTLTGASGDLTVHVEGVTVPVTGRYYNQEIGNTDNDGTSPLMED